MNAFASALRAYFDSSAPSELVSAYLFGSAERGTAHAESDVDVGVLFAHEPRTDRAARSELRIGLASELIHALGRDAVDVVVLNDAPPGLGRHVVTRGERVYCRNAEADHAFVRDIQLRAADVEPFLRRMRRIKLEVLRS